jgi:hypothetical protein
MREFSDETAGVLIEILNTVFETAETLIQDDLGCNYRARGIQQDVEEIRRLLGLV